MAEMSVFGNRENLQLVKDALVFLVPIAVGFANVARKKFDSSIQSLRLKKIRMPPVKVLSLKEEAALRGMSVNDLIIERMRENAAERSSPLH